MSPRTIRWGSKSVTGLVPLVDAKQGGELMARIKGVRKKLTQELGFLIQPVHIRDNLELQPSSYRITLHGVPIGSGQVYPDRDMALNPGRVFGTVEGINAKDPTFGLDAVWIERGARDHAQTLGYTVVDPATVIATHLSQIVKDHAHELLGFDEAQQLLNALQKTAPKLVEDLVPKVLSLSVFVRVLQTLLSERVPLKNLRGIAEALAEAAPAAVRNPSCWRLRCGLPCPGKLFRKSMAWSQNCRFSRSPLSWNGSCKTACKEVAPCWNQDLPNGCISRCRTRFAVRRRSVSRRCCWSPRT